MTYGYALALPADWTALKQAFLAWHGTGAPDHESAETDLFESTAGTIAWAYAAPTTKTLAALTAAQTTADSLEHPCPATPEIDEPTRIAGQDARLTVKHCPVTVGTLIEMATVIRHGRGYVFYFQHPPTAEPRGDDIAVFKSLLSGVTLP